MKLGKGVIAFRMPDLGLGDLPMRVSAWHKPIRAEVTEGEQVLEIESAETLVDLAAPTSGLILEQLVQEEDIVVAGQLLATIAETKEFATDDE